MLPPPAFSNALRFLLDERRPSGTGEGPAELGAPQPGDSFDFHKPQGTQSPVPFHRANSRLPSPPSPAGPLLHAAPPLSFARSRSKAEFVPPCPGWLALLPKRYPRDGRGGGCNWARAQNRRKGYHLAGRC